MEEHRAGARRVVGAEHRILPARGVGILVRPWPRIPVRAEEDARLALGGKAGDEVHEPRAARIGRVGRGGKGLPHDHHPRSRERLFEPGERAPVGGRAGNPRPEGAELAGEAERALAVEGRRLRPGPDRGAGERQRQRRHGERRAAPPHQKLNTTEPLRPAVRRLKPALLSLLRPRFTLNSPSRFFRNL